MPVMTNSAGDDDGGDDVVECPECGVEIYVIADRCPKCGYWVMQEDRRAMRANRRSASDISERAAQMRIIKIAAIILLAVMALAGLVALGAVATGYHG